MPSRPDLTCDLFLESLRSQLAIKDQIPSGQHETLKLFQASPLPQEFWGFALTIYQPGNDRLMVVRVEHSPAFENVRQVINRALQHQRFGEFDLQDRRCRVQVDFIVDKPEDVELGQLSDQVLPEKPGASALPAVFPDGGQALSAGLHQPGQVQVFSSYPEMDPRTRFEVGVDGLRVMLNGKRKNFLPGDAFVRSILGMNQLKRHIGRLFPGENIESLKYQRFRTTSYISFGREWLPLYRGLPPARQANAASLYEAAAAGADWIAGSLQPDGRFIYYYDAATDTRRDHEHPKRDPEKDPYYNLLRHGGAVATMLFDVAQSQRQEADSASGAAVAGTGGRERRQRLRTASEQAIDWFIRQLKTYQAPDGSQAAYALYNRKSKLGGSGIGLYTLALYQRLFGDDRYAEAARQLCNHLINEIDEAGEFRYYHIYLDKQVPWSENQRFFSFYYPGEAIIGLANYCRYVCASGQERQAVYAKTHDALRFLVEERPRKHRAHYQTLPSDSWLMMGINDLWDEPEFRRDAYKQFVFDDADQMVRLMYTAEDALYPDYVGSFYYHYGDHPYPDGARAEGLMGAYALAIKVGDDERIARYHKALLRIAWATLRLCNTAASTYSARNPQRATGGIRFKLTRQWFRVDTIQHVASFYHKFLLATRDTLERCNDIA